MTKRNRLEDLGRLHERLRVLFQHKLFDDMSRFSKHYEIDEYLATCTEEEKQDFFENLRYSCKEIEDEIAACLCIAQADDELNYNENKTDDGI